ncbi:MAG: DUF4011 domain-containing protein, partial [Bacilli bacterium]|nr:DUF4011 domain-containing protein [Bacilli bacterium]
MNENKIINWANLLLDVGKRNPLINFHGSKSSTLEVVIPDCATFLDKIEGGTTFELFDVKKEDGLLCDDFGNLLINKEEYVSFYQDKIRKATHFLGYNKTVNPQNALKNIMKKGRSAIEETGVNVSYIAFGFVHFRDIKDPKEEMMAPILLIPAKITRKSIVDPFFIKELEDEVIVNPTLSYKFLSDYKVELPEYEANTGAAYFDLINDVITNLGFYITKEVFIGSFSFQKINMYNDILSNIDYIKENNNVKILMDDEAFDSPLSDFNYDSDTELSNLHSVVDADNSQIDAIELSKSGASFVLQGPPGTGKSQTITNIIAEALYDNKKVLFVSEKLAALNVVYDKLKQSGLSDFCLELHSHKANKKDLIDELARTLRLEATKVSSRADEVVSDKINNIEKLASYDELLHEKRSILNLSLYELIDNVHKYQNNYDN